MTTSKGRIKIKHICDILRQTKHMSENLYIHSFSSITLYGISFNENPFLHEDPFEKLIRYLDDKNIKVQCD